jgi:hypothetical protein
METTPHLREATERAFKRTELVRGDLVAAFDRMGTGLQGPMLKELVERAAAEDEPLTKIVFSAAIIAVEADRAQQAMLARHARAYAAAERRWDRNVNTGQQTLDGMEPARHIPGSLSHQKQLRTGVWVRAGGCCEDCGKSGKGIALDLHHLTYERFGRELPEDVLLICRECHEHRHGRRIPA